MDSMISEEVSKGDFLCPWCTVEDEAVVELPATLIVAPSSIVEQWMQEIRHHCEEDSLKVTIYSGIRNIQSRLEKRRKIFHPSSLCSKQSAVDQSLETEILLSRNQLKLYDIVITSYETLREEIYFLKDATVELRYKKRYKKLPSPLIGVYWWRLVLDEAQMVGGFTLAGRMAKQIKSKHRWCVSGTPIVHRLGRELAGLLSVLSPVEWLKPLSSTIPESRLICRNSQQNFEDFTSKEASSSPPFDSTKMYFTQWGNISST
ncbi:hypothetical protein IE077_003407, partial [Cardiosporidium cionae]